MSDHRFGLKIWFSIYGKEFEWNPDLNWNNHDGDVDGRIIDWFADCYAEARAGYDSENDREQKRRAAAALEESERSELARLKAKYELAAIPLTSNPFIPQGDAPASTDDFSQAYDGEGWGRMSLPDGEYGVQWHGPTPAGDFSATGIICRVCGHKVEMKRGDIVKRGDPRLCQHLGGPVKRHDPECYLRTEDGTPCNCGEIPDPYKPGNEISDRFEPR